MLHVIGPLSACIAVVSRQPYHGGYIVITLVHSGIARIERGDMASHATLLSCLNTFPTLYHVLSLKHSWNTYQTQFC